jgi:ATP-dependent Lhr-like helicase
VVAHLCHLDRGTVEQILAQLAVQGYLQPHGFKNQYGADEKLYYLVDYHLIYGNFGASSHVIEVRHGAKILGMVPSVNLLRVKRGHYVRFTGAVWKVRRAALTGIDLDPIHMRKEALDFIYPGQRHTSDPFIADRIWQLLHTSDLSLHLLANPLKNCIQNCLDQVRQQSFANQIPYSRGSTGIRYLTFAGYMVNRAVALVIGQTICHADDFSLVVPSPMQWQTIPTDPSAYKHIFSQLFEGSGEQSLYQTLLPGELQLRECIQDWLCNETIPHILSRLATATPVAISENLADELGGLLRNDYHL